MKSRLNMSLSRSILVGWRTTWMKRPARFPIDAQAVCLQHITTMGLRLKLSVIQESTMKGCWLTMQTSSCGSSSRWNCQKTETFNTSWQSIRICYFASPWKDSCLLTKRMVLSGTMPLQCMTGSMKCHGEAMRKSQRPRMDSCQIQGICGIMVVKL